MKTYEPLSESLSDDFSADHDLVVISRPPSENFSDTPSLKIIHLTGSLEDVLHELADERGGEAITNIHEFLWDASKAFVDEACDIVNGEDNPDSYDLKKLIEYANAIQDHKKEFLAELEDICGALPMTERLEAYAGHCRDSIAAALGELECMFLPTYEDNEIYPLEVFATQEEMFKHIAESDHYGFHPGALVMLTSDDEVARFIKTDGKLAESKYRKDILTVLTDFVRENEAEFPEATKQLAARSPSDDHDLSQ